MPVHDWTRVDAGIFHAFHHDWITDLARALNRGILPGDYYALPEQHAAGFGFSPFADMTLDLWRHVMRVELDIVFHTTQPAWRYLCDSSGGVVIMTSMSWLRSTNAACSTRCSA